MKLKTAEQPASVHSVQPITSGLPIGPPPQETPLPDDFEGYVELCKMVSRGAMTDKALIWATLAQAVAQKALADRMEELLEYLGAYDENEEELDEPPRFADQIAMGVQSAVFSLKDDFGKIAAATQEFINQAHGKKS